MKLKTTHLQKNTTQAGIHILGNSNTFVYINAFVIQKYNTGRDHPIQKQDRDLVLDDHDHDQAVQNQDLIHRQSQERDQDPDQGLDLFDQDRGPHHVQDLDQALQLYRDLNLDQDQDLEKVKVLTVIDGE